MDIALVTLAVSVCAFVLGIVLLRRRRRPAEFAHEPRVVRARQNVLTRPCPSCGVHAAVTDTECASCTGRLSSRRLLCPKCGLVAGATGRFCVRCHASLG
jgi:predicted RNA-binding Zn-ribbon protein involved in translation (DUF1610 family)